LILQILIYFLLKLAVEIFEPIKVKDN